MMAGSLILVALLSLVVGVLGGDVSSAEHCLSLISNLVVLNSASPKFETQQQPFNSRLSTSPSLIVFPTSEQQIQFIINCATSSHLSVSTTSGDHSYASHDLEGDIVVDLSNLKGVAVRPEGGNVSSAEHCLSLISNLVVLNSASPSFEAQKQPFNLRMPTSPSLIVFPTSEQQIQFIIVCATSSSLSVSARSGGHSYAAYALEGDIVVDLSNLKGVAVNPDGTAVVQTGNRLGEVATKIFAQGQRALAHGSCPYVGSGGHTLYGGFGYFSRIRGLLLDQVVSAQVVLANGSLVTASNTSHTDLFWAIRGGGPSFGLVTSWTYQTVLAPPITDFYNITLGTTEVSELISAYLEWQSFATTAPIELAMAAVLSISGGTLSLTFTGNYYGPDSRFRLLMSPLMRRLPRTATLNSTPLGWIAGLEALAGNNGTLNTTKPQKPDTFFTKSLAVKRPSSEASISSWIHYLAEVGSVSDTDWFAQVDLYGSGGAIADVPADATAFAQRDAFLVYQLYASSYNHLPPYPTDGIPFVDGMLAALDPYPQGAYSNYIDPTLRTEEWQRLYFNNHVQRLKEIKAKVDPTDVFKFSQGF